MVGSLWTQVTLVSSIPSVPSQMFRQTRMTSSQGQGDAREHGGTVLEFDADVDNAAAF